MATRRLPLLPVVLATLLALAAAAGVVLLFGGDDDGDGDGGEAAGSVDLQPAGELPESTGDVVLGALDGGPDQVLGDHLGEKPVVLNFFAEWCAPCLREMPDFEAVHLDLGDQVTVLGLAVPPGDPAAIVEETGVTYPTFEDTSNSALTFFGGTVMPTTVFIDAAGEVVHVESRPLDEDELRAAVDEHLGVAA